MSILASGLEIPTFGLADELRAIDLDDTPTFEAYGTDPARTNYVIPAPAVENVVPEPGTLSLLALGGLGLLARRRRG
jgi:hypothetical protein